MHPKLSSEAIERRGLKATRRECDGARFRAMPLFVSSLPPSHLMAVYSWEGDFWGGLKRHPITGIGTAIVSATLNDNGVLVVKGWRRVWLSTKQ